MIKLAELCSLPAMHLSLLPAPSLLLNCLFASHLALLDYHCPDLARLELVTFILTQMTSCAIHDASLPLPAATTGKVHPEYEPVRALRTQCQRTYQRQAGEFSALARAWVLRVIFFPRLWPV